MTNIRIDKTNSKSAENNINKSSERRNKREREIVSFLQLLLVENENFDTKGAFEKLKKYIEKYDRILYAPISNWIYGYCQDIENEDSEDEFGKVLSNMDKLVEYSEGEECKKRFERYRTEESKRLILDTQKTIIKIQDHLTLAHQQFGVLRQSDAEYSEKFMKLITPHSKELTKDMSNQLLTMVSIFTALAFLLFGGISSLSNLFSAEGFSIAQIICIGAVWGLCMANVLFLFMFCIGKMTKVSFSSSEVKDATFFEKYSLICWTDFILAGLIGLSLLLGYFEKNGLGEWIAQECVIHPLAGSVGGTVLLLLILFVGASWLKRKTTQSREKNVKKRFHY